MNETPPRPIVLFVQCQPELRTLISLELGINFNLISVSDFETASRFIESLSNIDILITDFKLRDPDGRTGLTLSHRFRKKYPSAPLVLMTVSDLSFTDLQHLKNDLKGLYVQMPILTSELIGLVRSQMEGRAV